MNEEQILCACSAYEQKYYFNPRYQALPTAIQEELKIMAVTLTADVGGVFTMEFDEDGTLYMSTTAKENDFAYDEIRMSFKDQTISRKICGITRKPGDILPHFYAAG